ncbi:hypothetical protein [Streptomyces orinoci]|uniref:Uncharacterized protein n=1 Tax=Streptomyces orinoci TaxID=67339 RepID=A0ABV3JVB1_STRON|nr:hypothetical protein [Streptomyces orinoci]
MGSAVTFWELDRIAGEPLPPRTVLSTVAPPGADHPLYRMLVRSEHGTTVAYACQYRQDPGSPGLLAALGLASSTPGYTMSCIPAAVSSH